MHAGCTAQAQIEIGENASEFFGFDQKHRPLGG
jgi:hypothetical protein